MNGDWRMDKIMALLRFMKQDRVYSFLCGELYLNTLQYFAALEGDAVRSDIREGAQFARQVAKTEIADENGK